MPVLPLLLAVIVVAPVPMRGPSSAGPVRRGFERVGHVHLEPLPFGLGLRPRTARRVAAPAPADGVVFHLANGTYHCASCPHVRHCVGECETIPLAAARPRGTACRSCGGACDGRR